MRVLLPILFVLLVTIAIVPIVSADPIPGSEMKCWTDQPTYRIGDVVTIYVSIQGKPQPGEAGSGFTLSINKPDGSHTEIELGDLTDGVYSSSATAGPPPGTRDVSLFWHVAPGKIGLALVATCSFEVIGGPADLEVEGVWASPSNPHQEDMVSFSVNIANIGGADANSFLVQVYLDGTLWDSRRASLPAGSSMTFTSDRQYQAEDGPHNVRWVVNSDGAVQESNYGNNEGSGNFYVSPRTVTLTEHATLTRTKTQTEKQTLTMTTVRTLTFTYTTDTTTTNTVTATRVVATSTLTGLVTSTIYSPIVTITVAVSAQMIFNPVPWIALSTFAVIVGVFQLPKSERLRRFSRRFSFPQFLTWVLRRDLRKALLSMSLILVMVISIMSQVGQEAYASTVTTTRTLTSTEWATLAQSLTSTRYITSTATDTSAFTRTKTGSTTITPTVTMTVDHRSLTTVYVQTTVTVTSTMTAGYGITKISRVYYDPFRREIVDVSGTVVKNGDSFDVQLALKNLREGFYQVKVYSGPVYFQPASLAYESVLWPEQTLYPVKVRTPEFGDGSQICVDVELQITLEAVVFAVDVILPVPVDVASYGQNIVWLKSELISHMISQGYLRSDYESKPDAVEFLTKFSDLCGKEPKYVLSTLAEFAKSCYITFEMDGLESAIESFASKWLLPFKLLLWDIHVWQTPATEIVYVDIGKTSGSGAG